MQSMTGYGSGRASLGEGHVVLDMRTVNHRYLDVRVRLPSRIQSRTAIVERVVRAHVTRGRVDVTARFEGQTLPHAALDMDRARVAYRDLISLRDALSPEDPVPLSLLSLVPDLFGTHTEVDADALELSLERATHDACEAVIAMRKKEGEALAEELRGRLRDLESDRSQLEASTPQWIEARRARLRDRVQALLSDADVELHPARLEQEIALLADRSDITEELVRLESHRNQMLELIENSDTAVGKRIDFLLQEMVREVNTIGSKAQDGVITSTVVSLKATIEQMREQAQNVL
ncbi:MAG: YicC/YloC family endoribonuclease [Myxococcales bacterium]|jgi:uncharacterized protein (TIGR00255 family)